MKFIEVDEELYRYIASHTEHIGESASDILRRMLSFTPDTVVCHSTELTDGNSLTEELSSTMKPITTKSAALHLEQRINAGDFMVHKKVVDRFIMLLATLYAIDPLKFSEATQSLQGRTRVYFAKEQQTLLQHGKHTKPKQVVDTPYWVITNTNSERKRSMVTQIMKSMQFSDELIQQACAVVALSQ